MKVKQSKLSERIQVYSCPLCRSEATKHHFFEKIKEAGGDEYRICDRCGLVFQSPRMTQIALDAYYAAEYRESVQGSAEPTEKDLRMQTARADHLVDFSSQVFTNVNKCMDIGSSAGLLLEAFRNKYGCEGFGIEPGEAYANFSRDKGFQAVSDIQDLDGMHEHTFDLVTMSHTLEHIPGPVDYLVALRKNWLIPSGYLLLEVPNLYGHHAMERAHLIAFSEATLRETVRQAGYDVLKVEVHGYPRSRLIPLYITLLARGRESIPPVQKISSKSTGVRAKRFLGMRWRWIATKLAPRWAWLPWPEIGEE
jgi:SAM-dependent methyltransferase